MDFLLFDRGVFDFFLDFLFDFEFGLLVPLLLTVLKVLPLPLGPLGLKAVAVAFETFPCVSALLWSTLVFEFVPFFVIVVKDGGSLFGGAGAGAVSSQYVLKYQRIRLPAMPMAKTTAQISGSSELMVLSV